MADWASEQGHFYTRTGEPAYTIIGANGLERRTTLRDARKHDFVFSVTGIIGLVRIPPIEIYKEEQVLLAALTLPRADGETEKSWLARVRLDAKEHARQAAKRGTDIHGALERYRNHQPFAPEFAPWIQAVEDALFEPCGPQFWKPEKSYAHRFGYGCKIDLHSDAWVIDYKGKEDAAREGLELMDEHYMQLAACRLAAGLPRARCAIVFFGRQTPWAHFMEAPEDELVRGWDCFEALLTFYQAKHRLAR